jgi:hypothetical protein
MAELIATSYRRFIEVRLLHHYWLDEGPVIFDQIPDQAKRESRLLTYDARRFLNAAPTPSTEALIKDLGCVYRETALGFVVAAPENVVVPLDAHFDFAVVITDSSFHDYTSLTLRPQNIYELYYQPEDRIYRYKENVPVFSNLTGVSRVLGGLKNLFLSIDYPATGPTDHVESLIRSGSALLQLTGDQPGATTQQIAASVNSAPVFVHQGDAHVIVPPAGLVGAPDRGILLTDDLPDSLFGLVRVSAQGAIDPAFDLVDNTGKLKQTSPVFQIRFKNRSTIWSYFDKRTRAAISTEPQPLPLTYFGNAGTKQKPGIGPVSIVQNGTLIAKLVSEIFV